MFSKPWQSESFESRDGGFGPLLKRALSADQRSKDIVSGICFRQVVDEMAEVVAATGRRALVGASAEGHALVGALTYVLPDARLWTPGHAEEVLVIDVVVASIAGLDATGQYACRMGATSVAALVVEILEDEPQRGPIVGDVMSLSRQIPLAA